MCSTDPFPCRQPLSCYRASRPVQRAVPADPSHASALSRESDVSLLRRCLMGSGLGFKQTVLLERKPNVVAVKKLL